MKREIPFQSKIKFLDLTYRASQEYINLEFSAGAQLESIKKANSDLE